MRLKEKVTPETLVFTAFEPIFANSPAKDVQSRETREVFAGMLVFNRWLGECLLPTAREERNYELE